MKEPRYKVAVNKKNVFEVSAQELENLDIRHLEGALYHLIFENQTYLISLGEIDFDQKELHFTIDDEPFTTKVKDHFDLLIQKMGLNDQLKTDIKNIQAPMPGIVLDILKVKGDAISKGDNVLILEAMKMENVLKAPADGIIDKIEVSKGQAVDKGQMLIVLE